MTAEKTRRVVRFAPSPSGRMHVGNVLSAMLCWLHAKSVHADLVLRLEDLDDRCASANSERIVDDLDWLGITFDEAAFSQADNGTDRYEAAFNLLEGRGLVYPCFCSRADLHAASAPHASDGTPLYAGTCSHLDAEQVVEKTAEILERTGHGPAWRLRVAGKDVEYVDGLQGPQRCNMANDCGDFVIRRGDGVYAYQLAVCVDDELGGVTDIVRGSDLASSAFRQMYIQDLLGYRKLRYYHHPMILAPDGRRLSKREKDCDLGAIRSRYDKPDVLLGKLAFLCGMLDDAMPVTMEDLGEVFTWDKICREDIKLTPCFDFL